jgi:GNAT superfamily N-acetyltransferase
MTSNEKTAVVFEWVDADTLAGDADWWGLYERAFPSHEREPAAVILRSVVAGAGVALRGRRDGRTRALAMLHMLAEPAVAFLVYLAVDENLRGGGIGTALFEQALAEGVRRVERAGLAPRGMVWEVDIPEQAASPEEADRRRRRIRFFERLGGRLLDTPYRQPPVDGVTPVPMRLMYRGVGDAEAAPPVDGLPVNELVRAIYFQKYGAMNGIPAAVLEELYVRSTRGLR